jgi:hypothetical protein
VFRAPSTQVADPEPIVETQQPLEQSVPSDAETIEEVQVAQAEEVNAALVAETAGNVLTPAEVEEQPKAPTEDDLKRVQLMNVLDSGLAAKLAGDLETAELKAGSGTVVIQAKNGLTAHIAYDLASETVIQHAYFVLEVQGTQLTAVPKVSMSVVQRGAQTQVSYAATDLLIGDFGGSFGYVSVDNSLFSRSGLLIDLVLDSQGSIISAKLRLIPRA